MVFVSSGAFMERKVVSVCLSQVDLKCLKFVENC